MLNANHIEIEYFQVIEILAIAKAAPEDEFLSLLYTECNKSMVDARGGMVEELGQLYPIKLDQI
jgi:hypothetical protein